MPIPPFKEIHMPFLKLVGLHEKIRMKDAVQQLADEFDLTEEERTERLPSGDVKFGKRVWWSRQRLKRAGLVDYPDRGYVGITEEGRGVLDNPPKKIDSKFLMKFPSYAAYMASISPTKEKSNDSVAEESDKTPYEIMEETHKELENSLADDILKKIMGVSPDSFERLILNVLHTMGYGDTIDSSHHLGKPGDGGVDGVINQDILGLDRVYIQAKRHQETSSIGPGDIDRFSGSLGKLAATKGLFVTTTSFTKGAQEAAKDSDKHIILIDGQELARLMIRYGVGCRRKQSLHIQELDEDFFEDI